MAMEQKRANSASPLRPHPSAFDLSADAYTLTQLRYDLRKMKGHGLLERDGRRYCSLFHHRPEKVSKPPAKIETAYHKADDGIQNLIDRLAA